MKFSLKDCGYCVALLALIAGMVGLDRRHREAERVTRDQVHDQLRYAREYYYSSMSSVEQDHVRSELQLMQSQIQQLQAEMIDMRMKE